MDCFQGRLPSSLTKFGVIKSAYYVMIKDVRLDAGINSKIGSLLEGKKVAYTSQMTLEFGKIAFMVIAQKLKHFDNSRDDAVCNYKSNHTMYLHSEIYLQLIAAVVIVVLNKLLVIDFYV